MPVKKQVKSEFKSYIANQLAAIDILCDELRDAVEMGSPLVNRIKGSIIHDFYNICERIFETIARDMSGGILAGEKWHKILLYRMTLPVSGVRPAVITKELAADLDEYLSFRHVFRNIYGYELQGKRLQSLVEGFETITGEFHSQIKAFLKKI
jgi:hypothetical protein